MQQLPLLSSIADLVTRWKSILDPVLKNQLNDVSTLSSVALINGVTTINHKLGKLQQGWFIIDTNAAATIYRSQPFNDKTLVLTSNAAVTVNIGVF